MVPQVPGKALNQMAAISSTAACAPVTSHTKGSMPNLNTLVEIASAVPQPEPKQSFVDKIHGLTDKLQSTLGVGSGSNNASHNFMNIGSGASTLEDRNRTGKVLIRVCTNYWLQRKWNNNRINSKLAITPLGSTVLCEWFVKTQNMSRVWIRRESMRRWCVISLCIFTFFHVSVPGFRASVVLCSGWNMSEIGIYYYGALDMKSFSYR